LIDRPWGEKNPELGTQKGPGEQGEGTEGQRDCGPNLSLHSSWNIQTPESKLPPGFLFGPEVGRIAQDGHLED